MIRKPPTTIAVGEPNLVTSLAIVEFFSTVSRISLRVLTHIITLSNSNGIPPFSTKLVEKIRRWEYFDLSKLISEDFDNHVVISGQVVTVEPIPQLHRRHSQLDIIMIISWMEAYSKFLAVLLAAEITSHEEAAGLAAHMFQIIRLF